MSADGQRTKRRRKIADNFNRLSRAHERYRQTDRQTEGRTMTYRERTFTFAHRPSICMLSSIWLSSVLCTTLVHPT